MAMLSIGLALVASMSWGSVDPSLSLAKEQLVVTYDCQVPKGVRAYNKNQELPESAQESYTKDYRFERTFSSPGVVSVAFELYDRGHLLMPVSGPVAGDKQLTILSGSGYNKVTHFPRRGPETAVEQVELKFEGLEKPLKCNVIMESAMP